MTNDEQCQYKLLRSMYMHLQHYTAPAGRNHYMNYSHPYHPNGNRTHSHTRSHHRLNTRPTHCQYNILGPMCIVDFAPTNMRLVGPNRYMVDNNQRSNGNRTQSPLDKYSHHQETHNCQHNLIQNQDFGRRKI